MDRLSREEAEQFLAKMKVQRQRLERLLRENPGHPEEDAALLKEIDLYYRKGRDCLVASVTGFDPVANSGEAVMVMQGLLITESRVRDEIMVVGLHKIALFGPREMPVA
jgi:phosphate uptake regulator